MQTVDKKIKAITCLDPSLALTGTHKQRAEIRTTVVTPLTMIEINVRYYRNRKKLLAHIRFIALVWCVYI